MRRKSIYVKITDIKRKGKKVRECITKNESNGVIHVKPIPRGFFPASSAFNPLPKSSRGNPLLLMQTLIIRLEMWMK